VTFTGLGVTGLVQRYANVPIAQTMIDLMGGIESIRIVHRVLATILMAESIFHGGVLTYKLFVLGQRATMIPGLKDVKDVIQWIAYNLGWKREHPKMPRYNFGEKVEYLAVVWGTIVMVITGFMMWNPIASARFLPGELIPAARAAHSAEALLAVLSIVIWHMYNVHIRRFNRAMFTGKLPHDAMEEEHGEELEQIERGELPPPVPAEIIEKRKKIFWPYAIVMSTVLTLGLIWFVSFETSAVTTLPVRTSTINLDLDLSGGSAEAGQVIYVEQNCAQCHGEAADGGNDPLKVSIVERDLTTEAFIRAIRVGPAEMPAFPITRIPDAQLSDLWAYFQSLKQN
jgi:cytochrome b subunit of formate dehydrogenase